MLLQSSSVSLPISPITDKIMAIETIFTVYRKALMTFDFLRRGINGLSKATKRNEGRNIPIVAAMAPCTPPICQPMNVADENTGPGVNCPTAIASTNCCFVSRPFATNSASKKANNT